MFWSPLLFSLLLAVVVTFAAKAVFGWKGPWDNSWAFLAILFLTSWTGALWIGPHSPSPRASFGGLLITAAIVLAAVTFVKRGLSLSASSRPARIPVKARPKAHDRWETPGDPPAGSPELVTRGIYFWALIGLLALAILWALTVRPS